MPYLLVLGGVRTPVSLSALLQTEPSFPPLAEQEASMELLRCCMCKAWKPAIEFYTKSSSKSGYGSRCKVCDKQYAHERYLREREKIQQYNQQYYLRTREKQLKAAHDRHVLKREEIRAYRKLYYLRRIIEFRLKAKERSKQKYQDNPDYFTDKSSRRRRLIKKANKHETVLLSVIYTRDKGICQLCHKKCARKDASRDHVIPISEGGDHTYQNCVLAHRWCNISKGNRPFPQQQRLFG
jgi:5-methylcytosine-specific restriction endonuclease McrA